MSTIPTLPFAPLSQTLVGSWWLQSRIDLNANGERHAEPLLGEDPVALLIYDRGGHFAAQFMKRDRSAPAPDANGESPNNSRAQDGYDAYFGTYSIDDASGTVTQTLLGALARQNVGMTLTRAMQVVDDMLIVKLDTSAWDGAAVTRTLTWRRVA